MERGVRPNRTWHLGSSRRSQDKGPHPEVHRGGLQSLSRTPLPLPRQIQQSGQQCCRHLGGQCNSGPGRASPEVGKTRGHHRSPRPSLPGLSWTSYSFNTSDSEFPDLTSTISSICLHFCHPPLLLGSPRWSLSSVPLSPT